MALLFGGVAALSTLLGGLFALRRQDKLHLILGFSAGAVIGVAFFDLLPEALGLGAKRYGAQVLTMVTAAGFLAYMLLHRALPHVHPVGEEAMSMRPPGWLAPTSLALHSFLDGVGMGLAFQVSVKVGIVVAFAVITHDFSDGINTVGVVLRSGHGGRQAFRWLLVDASAPFLGVASTRLFSLQGEELGLVLALFCGFFLFIGAADLVPESHHRHPHLVTSLMTLLGAGLIYFAIHMSPW